MFLRFVWISNFIVSVSLYAFDMFDSSIFFIIFAIAQRCFQPIKLSIETVKVYSKFLRPYLYFVCFLVGRFSNPILKNLDERMIV